MKNKIRFLGLGLSLISASPGFAFQVRTDLQGFTVTGIRGEETLSVDPVKLPGNDGKSHPIKFEAVSKKGEKIVFEMEVQERDAWNNGNDLECDVTDVNKKQVILNAILPQIDISQASNVVRVSHTPLPTSGILSWAVIPDHAGEDYQVHFEVSCHGFKWGMYAPTLVLKVRKTIYQ